MASDRTITNELGKPTLQVVNSSGEVINVLDSWLSSTANGGENNVSGMTDIGHKVSLNTVHASAAETATTQSSAILAAEYSEGIAYLSSAAGTGTSPTLDIKLQTSYDGSTWFDHGSAFTQVTTSTSNQVLKFTNYGKYIRFVYTIGGTTPSFTFTLQATLKS